MTRVNHIYQTNQFFILCKSDQDENNFLYIYRDYLRRFYIKLLNTKSNFRSCVQQTLTATVRAADLIDLASLSR